MGKPQKTLKDAEGINIYIINLNKIFIYLNK